MNEPGVSLGTETIESMPLSSAKRRYLIAEAMPFLAYKPGRKHRRMLERDSKLFEAWCALGDVQEAMFHGIRERCDQLAYSLIFQEIDEEFEEVYAGNERPLTLAEMRDQA